MALIDIDDGFWALRRQMEALIGRTLASRVMQQAGANGFGEDNCVVIAAALGHI
jgi:hypothetical protein